MKCYDELIEFNKHLLQLFVIHLAIMAAAVCRLTCANVRRNSAVPSAPTVSNCINFNSIIYFDDVKSTELIYFDHSSCSFAYELSNNELMK